MGHTTLAGRQECRLHVQFPACRVENAEFSGCGSGCGDCLVRGRFLFGNQKSGYKKEILKAFFW